ncbi:uncharacterized protein EKO05_0008172 [Ascochyta rabiei]|uniref:Uncharacterized protein n=1 Tax=Didymella rabiei TaxID=5454 RepID=A0A163DB14_DIDRA|nr:uncharacterized protein EKO05_0008172 [Ascochyta rabiei]KZM23040.1 hypothetical protein ST47_g5854 [Ascochyta rabiei]UPX17844.1 hypothetical protein EKO05_0008172 [Ascochyta rabiei]
MSNNQYSLNYASYNRNTTATHFQTVNPYAALVATAGPEHDGRSSSSGSAPSIGSSSSLVGYKDAGPSRSYTRSYSSSGLLQQHVSYRSPEKTQSLVPDANSAPTRNGDVVCFAEQGIRHTAGRTSISSAFRALAVPHPLQRPHASSLTGVPEALAVQEMAFRHGQRNNSSTFNDIPANPFAKQFDQLWATFYKLGKECSTRPVSPPANLYCQNFAWPVLINPHTQSLEHPNGSLDPAWTGKMIHIALNCMEELIRITCRRNMGWEKLVADIPLPAQEALMAFPDLAQRYERLKRDAKEARAGGRPYGY